MPNLRKNLFSTDFYHLFQSTEKKDLWTNLQIFSYLVRLLPPPIALSRLAVSYGQKNDLWTNLQLFSYSVWLLPNPIETRGISRAASELFSATPQSASEISGVFEIQIGQPWFISEEKMSAACCTIIHDRNV